MSEVRCGGFALRRQNGSDSLGSLQRSALDRLQRPSSSLISSWNMAWAFRMASWLLAGPRRAKATGRCGHQQLRQSSLRRTPSSSGLSR